MFGIDDALLIGGALSALGGIASAGMSMGASSAANGESYKYTKKLQEQQQAYNSAEAQISRDFNAKQAAITRNWQAQMSNSAYSRAVQDLKNANLNPLLAVGAQASTPSGATASSTAASSAAGSVHANAPDFSGLANGLGGAGQLISKNPQVKAQVAESNSRVGLNIASAAESAMRTKEYESQIALNKANTYKALEDAKYPGLYGGWLRASTNQGKQLLEQFKDMSNDGNILLKENFIDPALSKVNSALKAASSFISHSPSSSSSSVSAVKVKDSPRMRHETSKYSSSSKSKRRHN